VIYMGNDREIAYISAICHAYQSNKNLWQRLPYVRKADGD
jgi:hypothetical protein